MGMFDDVTCEYPLPAEPKPKGNDFQTKDFDCLMDQYVITADGRLFKDGSEMQFQGNLNFYTYIPADNMWFEYEAKFINGRLEAIQPISICQRDAVGRRPRVFYPPGR